MAVYPQLILRKYIAGAIVLAVGVALNSYNVLASLFLLFIEAIPIVFYWYFSVKPYYNLYSEYNMQDAPRNNRLKSKTNFSDHTQREPRFSESQARFSESQDSETKNERADMSGKTAVQEASSHIKTTAQPAATEVPTQLTPDETRLAEIEAELKKIPVAKVKQWYAHGKLTDEQYKAIALKYNTLKKERDDIKERLELLKSI